jgi:hypothetical protein
MLYSNSFTAKPSVKGCRKIVGLFCKDCVHNTRWRWCLIQVSIKYTPKCCITWSISTVQWTYNQLQRAASKSCSSWCVGCSLLCILDARHWYFKIVFRPEKVCCIINSMKLNLPWECNSFVLCTKQIPQVIRHFVVGTCSMTDDCVFNPLVPELLLTFLHTLYLKCE